MKKLLGIISITVLIFSNSVNAGVWGEGELQLSSRVARWFIQYIRGNEGKPPGDFYVTLDGTGASSWYCPHGTCRAADNADNIKSCERNWNKKCKKFAVKRTIRWKNGINPAKGKASIINSKWSDAEIYAKLTELGFYNNNSLKKTETKAKIKKKKVKKTENNISEVGDLTEQLKALNELYKSGVLTKEEFTKAKKKLLN